MAVSGKVIVYGGRGALGSVIVKHLKSNNYWVLSIDLAANDAADANILVQSTDSWTTQASQVENDVSATVKNDKIDGIFCVAGGWAGGNAANADMVKNSDLMWKQSVWSSVIASTLASKHLREGGVLQLTGAQPALCPTPGMMGYGMAKAAVHQLTRSLAEKNSGLPKDSSVLTILPVTLDTPMNRKFMPNADFSTWTPLEYVAGILLDWIVKKDRPASGSLLKLVTKDNQTEVVPAE